jgi:hypothetical protein
VYTVGHLKKGIDFVVQGTSGSRIHCQRLFRFICMKVTAHINILMSRDMMAGHNV